MALKTIETRTIISAQDRTGATFSQVAQKLRSMEDGAARASKRMDALAGGMSRVGAQKKLYEDIANGMSKHPPTNAARLASGFAGRANNTALGVAGLMAAEKSLDKVADLAQRTVETYKQYDDLVRYKRAILGINAQQEKPLNDQAIHMGASTKFNDIQVHEAQLSLAQRGVKTELIEPIVKFAADFGQAMGVDLPTAAKALESALFSTGQNMETATEALKNAQHTTDIMVKTAKIGGLDAEGVQLAFKYGGAATHAAGLSIETMGALVAMMSRGGIRGDEGGVAARSFAGTLVSPTKQGLMTLNALGLDFNKYTTMPGGLSAENLGKATKRELGKDLPSAVMAHIQEVMEDKELVANREDFTKEITPIIGELFEKKKDGTLKAQDAHAIARVVGNFWKASIESVDTERLLHDFIAAHPSAAQANTMFSKQQGGRFQVIAQRGVEEFDDFVNQLKHVKTGFAASIGTERMGGYAGAVSRWEGSQKNLETALGRANDFWMTPLINASAGFVQKLVEGGDGVMRLVTATGAAVTGLIAFESALKAGSMIQTVSGNPASAAAIAGLGGGVAGRLGMFGLAGFSGLGFGAIAYRDEINSALTGKTLQQIDDEREMMASTRSNFKLPWQASDQGEASSAVFDRIRSGITGDASRSGINSFGFGPSGVKLDGAADIRLKVEVSADENSVVKKVMQQIDAFGALRRDAGVTMNPTGR